MNTFSKILHRHVMLCDEVCYIAFTDIMVVNCHVMYLILCYAFDFLTSMFLNFICR